VATVRKEIFLKIFYITTFFSEGPGRRRIYSDKTDGVSILVSLSKCRNPILVFGRERKKGEEISFVCLIPGIRKEARRELFWPVIFSSSFILELAMCII
jgi:hypothetical protein